LDGLFCDSCPDFNIETMKDCKGQMGVFKNPDFAKRAAKPSSLIAESLSDGESDGGATSRHEGVIDVSL
jgi:hypothetical protein